MQAEVTCSNSGRGCEKIARASARILYVSSTPFFEFLATALACDQYFFVKLAPLYSVQTELSVHAKNPVLIKNFQCSLFLEQVTIKILPEEAQE